LINLNLCFSSSNILSPTPKKNNQNREIPEPVSNLCNLMDNRVILITKTNADSAIIKEEKKTAEMFCSLK
jgi:hypothetical protein